MIVLFLRPRHQASELALRDLADALKIHGKDGLDAVLVADGPGNDVDHWVRSLVRSRSFRIATETEGQISAAFFATTVPYAALVDRDGRIRFEGEPVRNRLSLNEALETALAKPRTVPRALTSERFRPAWNAMDRRKFQTAIEELLKICNDPAATPEDAANANAMLAMVAAEGERALAAARKLKDEKEWTDALAAFEAVAAEFAGIAPGDRAAAEAEAIRGDKKLKKELEAGAALREARRLEEAGKPADAIAKYRLVASRFKGTRAAEHAKKRLDELEKRSR